MFVMIVKNFIKHCEGWGFFGLFLGFFGFGWGFFLRKITEIATFDEISNSNSIMLPGGTLNKLETRWHFVNAVSMLDWRVSIISECKTETPGKTL